MSTQALTRKFSADTIMLDKDFTVSETAEFLSIEPAVIAREGVFQHDDGRAYKAGLDLERAAEVSRVYIAWGHPPLEVVTKPEEIIGTVDGLQATRDGGGVKVKASALTFHKKRMNTDQAELLRSGSRRHLSIGYYHWDEPAKGTWGGQAYDYVQHITLIDHVASVDHGRCAYPACGIGVDAPTLPGLTKIGNDPYPNEHSCRIKDPGGFQERSFRRLQRGRLHMIIGRPEGQRTTTLQAFRYPKSKWSVEEARAHCGEHGGHFEAATDQGDSVMSELKADYYSNVRGSQRFQPTEVNLRNAEPDGDRCGDCVFFHAQDGTCQIVSGPIGAANVCDEFLGRPTLEEMVTRMHGDRELSAAQRAGIPRSQWVYTPSDNRSEWKLPMPDRRHVVAALQTVQGSRGGVEIPRSALPAVKAKLCRMAKHYGIRSEYCGTDTDAVKLMQTIRTMSLDALVDFHRRIHTADDYTQDALLHRAVLNAIRKKR